MVQHTDQWWLILHKLKITNMMTWRVSFSSGVAEIRWKKKEKHTPVPMLHFFLRSYHQVFRTGLCEVRTIHFHVLNLPESTSRKWRNPADFTDWKTAADMQMRAEADTFPSFNFSVLMYHLELHRASSQESLCLWMLMGSLYVNNK